jgi:hypothetical protein
MALRRMAVLASLVLLPGIAVAQRCIGTDNGVGKNASVMTVGGRLDLQDNANSFGGTFGIANGMAGKPMYMRAHLRVITYPGTTGTGFGFTLGKALVSTATSDYCFFGSLEQVSVSGGSSSGYELGGAWGNSTPLGDTGGKLTMFIRGGALIAMGGGTTSTDPFAEVGIGPTMKGGLSVNVSYLGVFSDLAYDMYRVNVTFPLRTMKR